MLTIEAIAARAEEADGTAPLDEATLMALRDGSAQAIVRAGSFAVIRGTEVSLVVDPPVRGHGLGGALFAEVLATHPDVDRMWSHGNHPAAARLAARHGWVRVRDLWVMRLATGPTTGPLPPLRVPDGVVLGSWSPELRDELLRVNAAAFADHPEQGAMDEANLAARMAEPWFDPAGLIVATDESGRLLAFHWTKQHSPTLGEVYVVAVDPAEQGRGLGRLVTLAGLHHLADSGVEEVLLYVEADNAAAVATYSRLGFAHAEADTHVMYARRR